MMNGEERSYGWVRPTSRHLSHEFERRYGVRNSRSFVSKYSYRARFKLGSSIVLGKGILQKGEQSPHRTYGSFRPNG
ncbi:unnamed protein product [Onchocerca flexuosa]|uniref:Uncharacterized protein n=1 Tax=Onchocerca flexuosa TaxID=387005 RepID=A0A183GZV8_9BILA|nr:unnamed protein product [Onchocerca flexuosa]